MLDFTSPTGQPIQLHLIARNPRVVLNTNANENGGIEWATACLPVVRPQPRDAMKMD